MPYCAALDSDDDSLKHASSVGNWLSHQNSVVVGLRPSHTHGKHAGAVSEFLPQAASGQRVGC